MMKKVYRVEGMHCSNCAMSVEGIEDDLPGIRQVSASYQKAQMTVEFEEQLVSEEQNSVRPGEARLPGYSGMIGG